MNLLGKAHDPRFWEKVKNDGAFEWYRKELLESYRKYSEKYPDGLYPALKYSEFKLFWTTGDRSTYQAPYFERRRAMETAALLCLIYPENEEYLSFLMNTIYTVCDEYTWCLPAHQGQLEPNNNVKIDLFASETGFQLAEIYTLLGDRLEPLIRNRIMAETERRIIIPYTSVSNYGWWENGNMNWTAVCTASVACTVMLLYPHLLPELQHRFDASMNSFLTGFKDDGVCFEGCGYWHYGLGFFVMYADMIRRFTDGKTDFFTIPKVKKVACFLQNMFLSGNASVSFSDGGRNVTYLIGLLHYLKNEYPEDVIVYSPQYGRSGAEKFCTHLRGAIWFDENIYNNPADNKVPTEFYAPISQWLVKRTPYYGFAAKGGNNNEFHNHNDVGSFIFAKNGKQLLMDFGSGPYTRQYFAAETRYKTVECSSAGHSLPIVDGVCQFASKDAHAEDFSFENGVLSMNIAPAYKCEGLERIDRSFTLTENTVVLRDRFTYSGNGKITDRMVTMIQPEIIDKNKVKVGDATVTFDPGICDIEISSKPRIPSGNFYFIDFNLRDGVKEFSATIE